MSVASLTRFTVPIEGSTEGLIHPKLKYRFKAHFENFGVSTPRTELSKQILDITRPSFSHENIVLDVYNSKINIAGKITWDTVTVNIRDDMSGEVTKRIGEQVQRQFDHFEQASPVAGADYKFILKYEMTDGGNGAHTENILETWELYGCYLENVNYGDMAYSSSEDVRIALTVRYDNALQIPIENGVGVSVPRNPNSQTLATG